MPLSIQNPNDSLERQNEKLLKIVSSLMKRVEEATNESDAAYTQFQRAALLEQEVGRRTRDLEHALDLLNESNLQLAEANRETEAARSNLANAIETIQEGFALFDAGETLVMCNSRFGMHMPDIRDRLKPGLTFAQYVEMVSNSPFLSLSKGSTPSGWAKRRLVRHKEKHVIFNVRMIWNRWVQVSEHRTPDGGTVVIQTDVTDIMRLERKEREKMLNDQARLIRATLDHLKQGVAIFDSKARVVGWNKSLSRLLPVSISNMHIGVGFDSIFDGIKNNITFAHPNMRYKVMNWVEHTTDREPLAFEIITNEDRILDAVAQEMPDKGFVISFSDVTAERAALQAMAQSNETLEQRVLERTLELEDALSEAERANASKSRFVAAASHDLLQPLSAAKLYLASFADEIDNPLLQEISGKANSALQSVENILEALLDISRLDSDLANLHISAVPVDQVLSQLADELTPMARAKGLDLRVVSTGAIVATDPTYFRRIVQNLVVNAIRYTETGKALVGARQRRNSILLQVADTGPGIPEDKHHTIFGEFERLNAHASAAEGMGLGLTIVERACALLNHLLDLKSTVGQGTTFSVELPLSGVMAFKSRGRLAGVVDTDLIQGKVALLIENDIDVQTAMALNLEKWGMDILTAASGSEALDLIKEIDLCPAIIVADFHLDEGEVGTDAISQIRGAFGQLPAIIITANRSIAVSEACEALNIRLMHKPIATDGLRQQLVECLEDTH